MAPSWFQSESFPRIWDLTYWNKATKTVTVQDGSQTVTMVIGSQQADINGQRVQMTKAPVLRGGTTLVPIRFVSEQMGLQVRWDNAQKSVYLTSSYDGVTLVKNPA